MIYSSCIDWRKFGKRLHNEIEKTGLSYRQLARDLGGPNHAMLHRVAHAKGDYQLDTPNAIG
jgi:ribosome-binding protein aMBF1 (putative translation factor)